MTSFRGVGFRLEASRLHRFSLNSGALAALFPAIGNWKIERKCEPNGNYKEERKCEGGAWAQLCQIGHGHVWTFDQTERMSSQHPTTSWRHGVRHA